MIPASKSDESIEDRELQDELKVLLDKIQGNDHLVIVPALEMLKLIIRTSTTSMTSVPKPLKYLAPSYAAFKGAYERMAEGVMKQKCADIISVLAMGPVGGDAARKNLDCLHFCLAGTMKDIGDWGHEYIRQLEAEITEEWTRCPKTAHALIPLVKLVVRFDCGHNAEIQACDLLMELDMLELLFDYIDRTGYKRVCLYLTSCAKYVDNVERAKILRLVAHQYSMYGESTKALTIAMQIDDAELVKEIFTVCDNSTTLKQMAFIAARQLYTIDISASTPERDEIINILSNSHLSSYFQKLARELEIMEPKTPEEVYKSWLEPTPFRLTILGENMDSARQNLAASFVNGFVNAGFGSDKLLTPEGGNKWIYRNKEHGMLSATASLGLLYLWDVDGGLTPIDKYLYTSEEWIKAGALMALGIVNCRVRNDCDPALALLADFASSQSKTLQIGAVLGLGLAYAGSHREDVLELLVPAVEGAFSSETLAVASLACGLVSVGACHLASTTAILAKILDSQNSFALRSSLMRLVVLGLGLCYMGARDGIEATVAALEVFAEPFKTLSRTILEMCAYAGSGDVLMVQHLLHVVSEHVEPERPAKEATSKEGKEKANKEKGKTKRDWEVGMTQAVATLAVAVVAAGEDIGGEMCQRILGDVGRYGDAAIRKAVPLAIAITSVSKPDVGTIDVLTKYAHDPEEDVACNAILCLGIVGAGTNNARLAAGLRQLAVFHTKNTDMLFMVRLAQGLTHLGKGTLTLSPFHTDRQLMDMCCMAGLLIPLVCLTDTRGLILGRFHYFLYALTTAIHPRWLLTVDEKLEMLAVTVRVGQGVDTVGKAGIPKTISGIHTHSTPLLLSAGERAELATDEYEQLGPTLDGICIVRKR